MALKNRINELSEAEKSELEQLIQDFLEVAKFSSGGQKGAKRDFETLLHSRKITMRILCKLSEWCNTDGVRYLEGRNLAIEISKILFGEIVPKLDSFEIMIDSGRIGIIESVS